MSIDPKVLLREADRRLGEPPYIRLCFDKQRSVLNDPSEFIAVCTGRRGGKSVSLAAKLLSAAFSAPGNDCLYLNLTRRNAKDLVWRELQNWNDKYNLGINFVSSDLNAFTPNGSMIRFYGADDERLVDRNRGFKYKVVEIDEAQSFGAARLEYLVNDVLIHCLGDLRGQLIVAGTPGPVPKGLFFRASKGLDGFSTHHWTIRENPHFPNPEEWIAKLKKKKGWTDDNPTYLREVEGLWVEDRDSLVYKYNPGINTADSLPDWADTFVLGVDLGYSDSTAFVVFAFNPDRPELFAVYAAKASALIPSRIAARIEVLNQRFPFTSIVVDAGGLGKGYVEEFKQSHGIPAKPAKKQHKLAFVEHLNGALRAGLLKVLPEASGLVEEWEAIQWNEERTDIAEGLEDHAADAALYAFREARRYYDPELEDPKYGTPEYYKKLEEDLEQKAADAASKEEDYYGNLD